MMKLRILFVDFCSELLLLILPVISVSLQHPDTCGPYKIKYVRDLTVGIDNSKPDNIPVSTELSTLLIILITVK